MFLVLADHVRLLPFLPFPPLLSNTADIDLALISSISPSSPTNSKLSSPPPSPRKTPTLNEDPSDSVERLTSSSSASVSSQVERSSPTAKRSSSIPSSEYWNRSLWTLEEIMGGGTSSEVVGDRELASGFSR